MRRRTIYGAASVATACLLATVHAGAQVPVAALMPASLQPPGDAATAVTGDSEIRNRIEAASSLVIAGEKLHGSLLRQFYAAHNYERVWATRQPQAEALLGAVRRAGEQGLDPDLFHAAALRNPALSPTDRELLLSDAFLSYADALARGALPIENRMDDEDLTPEPVNIPLVIDNAISSPNPAAVIEALAPTSPTYLALRRALPTYQAAAAAEMSATGTPAARGQKNDETRLRQILVNMERQRWLVRNLPADRVWVNIANAHLTLYQNNQPTFTTRVVVGETDKQTPELQSTITSLLYNPPWNVPLSIASKEILPKLSQQPNYLSRHHMTMRHNGSIQQLPGPKSALGQLKFEMVNRFDVYLHDTPLKTLFGRDNRQQSHGCVRVQNPRELASILLHQPVDVINKGIAQGTTSRHNLPESTPVFLVYQTAFADADGTLQFRPDVYDRDGEIWQALHPTRQAPVAEHEVVSPRRG
ncbi:MAG TPA: L,D-transpeptidase family protein [Stellaceae bacterium]|nr:L,D-transpeptidase family protein [Stellaceae bacterium]